MQLVTVLGPILDQSEKSYFLENCLNITKENCSRKKMTFWRKYWLTLAAISKPKRPCDARDPKKIKKTSTSHQLPWAQQTEYPVMLGNPIKKKERNGTLEPSKFFRNNHLYVAFISHQGLKAKCASFLYTIWFIQTCAEVNGTHKAPQHFAKSLGEHFVEYHMEDLCYKYRWLLNLSKTSEELSSCFHVIKKCLAVHPAKNKGSSRVFHPKILVKWNRSPVSRFHQRG